MEGTEGGNEPQVLASNNNTQMPKVEGNRERSKKSYKKIIIIIVIILLLGIGFWIYYTYFAKGTLVVKTNVSDAVLEIDGEEYDISNEKKVNLKPGNYDVTLRKDGYLTYFAFVNIEPLKKNILEVSLVNCQVIDDINNDSDNPNIVTVSDNGEIYYIDYDVNEIKKMLNDDKESVMKLDLLSNAYVTDYEWSTDGKSVYGLYLEIINDKDENKKYYVNLKDKNVSELNNNISSIAFSSNGSKIAYFYTNGDKKTLTIADPDGKNWQNIKNVGEMSSNITWIDDQNVSNLDVVNDKNNVIVTNITNGQSNNFEIDSEDVFVYSPAWSSDGQKALISIMKNDNQNLIVLDRNNGKITDLNQTNIDMNLVKWKDNNKIVYVTYDSSDIDNPIIQVNEYDLPSQNIQSLNTLSDYNFDLFNELFVSQVNTYLSTNNQILKCSKLNI